MATDQEIDIAVRVELYRQLVTTGVTPSASDVGAGLGLSTEAATAAFARLGAGRAIVLEPGDPSRVRMANPFSAIPTPFVVTAGRRRFWGNCIWDSLGIPACLDVDATIACSCGDCGEPMTVEVRDGRVEGAGIIHFGVPALHWWDNIIDT
ncbi:MAG: hypothetical protein C0506_15400 [Anaerolinea sp.]|nr:hypothetical protein [Anaerolinea sp.]